MGKVTDYINLGVGAAAILVGVSSTIANSLDPNSPKKLYEKTIDYADRNYNGKLDAYEVNEILSTVSSDLSPLNPGTTVESSFEEYTLWLSYSTRPTKIAVLKHSSVPYAKITFGYSDLEKYVASKKE